ncbi:hypothetical protein LCGC14_1530460 [marine sediment metagenome]|uniref:Uncharacterized protein n=1 Tax=marine sediment metagenome TaxID=412755 RepID=A0A0F9LWX7_9ZZZZ
MLYLLAKLSKEGVRIMRIIISIMAIVILSMSAGASPAIYADIGRGPDGYSGFKLIAHILENNHGPAENGWDTATIPKDTTRVFMTSKDTEIVFVDCVGIFNAYYFNPTTGKYISSESVLPTYEAFQIFAIENISDGTNIIGRRVSLEPLTDGTVSRIRTANDSFARLHRDTRVIVNVPVFPATKSGIPLTTITWSVLGHYVRKSLTDSGDWITPPE